MAASAADRDGGRAGRWLAAPVIAGALALRLWNLGARSLWTDEGSTWTAATAPLPELIRLCAEKDASPPLFYLLTSLAMRLGDDEVHLRLVSALASTGIVWLAYRLARLFAPRREAAFAAAVAALSPLQLMFAQEARTYALVACLATWSLYLFLRAAILGRPRAWGPYVAVTALAMYTQSIAALAVAVQAALAVLTAAGRRRLLPWMAGLAGVALLYLPWILVTLEQMSRLADSHWYVPPPDARGAFQVLRAVLLSPLPLVTPASGAALPGLEAWVPRPLAYAALAAIPLAPLAAAARGALGRDAAAAFTRIFLAALAIPLAVVFVASFHRSLWLPRYFVFLTPAVAVLIARGVFRIRPAAAGAAWGALVLVAGAYACFRYDRDYTKEPWRDVARAIAAAATRGGTAVLVPFDVDPFRFYAVRLEPRIPAYEVSHPDVPFSARYTPRQLEDMERRAAADVAGYDDVWVVVRSPNSEVRREIVERARRAAGRGRAAAGERRWDSVGGPLRVSRFVRRGGP